MLVDAQASWYDHGLPRSHSLTKCAGNGQRDRNAQSNHFHRDQGHGGNVATKGREWSYSIHHHRQPSPVMVSETKGAVLARSISIAQVELVDNAPDLAAGKEYRKESVCSWPFLQVLPS